MKLEIMVYIRNYIKEKFPMYYKFLNDREMANIINRVAASSLFKKLNAEKVLKGEGNSVIDGLVELYAQTYLTNIWVHFEPLCKYIEKVIVERNGKIEINNSSFKRFCMEIALDLTNGVDKDYDYNLFKTGNYDDKIYNNYETRLKITFMKLLKYVESVIDSSVEIKYDRKTFDFLIHNSSIKLMEDYDSNLLLAGKTDDKILVQYQNSARALKREVVEYLRNYIIANVGIIVGVNIELTVEEVIKKVNSGECSAIDILNGKLDSNILSFVQKNKQKTSSVKSADMYVYNYISSPSVNTSGLSESDLRVISSNIVSRLCNGYGYNINDILSNNCDNEILTIFAREVIKLGSIKVKKEDVRGRKNKIVKKAKKRKMNKTTLLLLSLGLFTLLGTSSLAYRLGTEVVDNFSDRKAINYVYDNFDKYDYSLIFTSRTDAFRPTAENVLTFYSNVKKFNNNNYNYLGFYTAYTNVGEDRLAIMDKMLRLVQSEMRSSENDDSFTREVCNYGCFLELACDRLRDMGYEKIDDPKYVVAVNEYMKASIFNDDKTPYEKLDKNTQRIIDEIMEQYREYSKEMLVDLGNFLKVTEEQEKNSVSLTAVNKSGR